MKKYLKEYEWSNIFAMLRNQKLEPELCTDDYYGHLVVITGATSGIGNATALKFASRGADILCINRNEEKLFWLSLVHTSLPGWNFFPHSPNLNR